MIERTPSRVEDGVAEDGEDQVVANLLEAVMRMQEAGQQVDIDHLIKEHPLHAQRLRNLLPTLQTLAAWGHGPVSRSSAVDERRVELPLEGHRLGDFQLLQEIGRGGMGTVFEAEQLSMGRKVALKLLPFASLVAGRGLERFRNEVRAAACLNHPHIVPVYSVGEERGIHYYSMQLIRGQSLAALIAELAEPRSEPAIAHDASTRREPVQRQRTWPELDVTSSRYRSAVRWGIEAASALQHAHDLGVLHRDIKPGNLLLDSDGKLYVTDFGLARISSDVGLTRSGDVVGTLRYMAPEQALAKSSVVDQRLDVYGLGVTLYELLTLRPAFMETDRTELLKQIAWQEPPAPSTLCGDVPAELETIVLKAMAKDPADRYATAQQLADDLAACQANRPIAARRPGWHLRITKWMQRNRQLAATMALALAVMVLSLLAGSTAISLAWFQQRAATTRALRQRDDLRYERYVADVNLAANELQHGDLTTAVESLAAHGLQADGSDLRGWEWHFLDGWCHQESVRLEEGRSPITALATSPDGHLVAISGADGVTTVRELKTKSIVATLTDGPAAGVADVTWSRDGHWIATALYDGRVIVWDATTFTVAHRLTVDRGRAAHAVEWSGDSRHLAAAMETEDHSGLVAIWDTAGQLSQSLAEEQSVGCIDWAPDHQTLVYGTDSEDSRRRSIITSSLDPTQPRREIARTPTGANRLRLSPDGTRLAIATRFRSLEVRDFASGRLHHDLAGLTQEVTAVAWEPSGARLAAAGTEGTIFFWNPDSGAVEKSVKSHAITVTDLVWSPDGKELVSGSADRTVKVWRPDDLGPIGLLPGSWSMALSPSGDQVVTEIASREGLGLVEVGTGRVLRQLPIGPDLRAGELAWSPDGDYVAATFTTEDENHHDGVVWSLPENREVQRLPACSRVQWSPDGRWLAIIPASRSAAPLWPRAGSTDASHEVVVIEFRTGREIARLPGSPWFSAVRWSPDGRRLAAFSAALELYVWNTVNWREEAQLDLYPEDRQLQGFGGHDSISWSPDGAQIAAVTTQGRLSVWDVDAQREVYRIPAGAGRMNSVAWNLDGTRLASLQMDGRLKIWDAATGRRLMALTLDDPDCSGLVWSPDGRRLLVGSFIGGIHRLAISDP